MFFFLCFLAFFTQIYLDNTHNIIYNPRMDEQLAPIITLLSENKFDEADLQLEELLNTKISADLKEKVKKLRSFIAQKNLKKEGLRIDAVFYILGAMQYYKKKKNRKFKKLLLK